MNNYRFLINGTEVDEPVGWDSVKFKKLRTDHAGLDQPFSDSLQFYGLGATLLKAEYDSDFVNGVTTITISNQYWSQVFSANYALYEELEYINGCPELVAIGLYLSGFEELVKSRLSTEVNLLATESLDGVDIGPCPLVNILMFTQPFYLYALAAPLAEIWSTNNLFLVFPYYWKESDFVFPVGSTIPPVGPGITNTNVVFVNNGSSTRTILYEGGALTMVVGTVSTVSLVFEVGTQATFKYNVIIRVYDAGNVFVSATEIASAILTGTVVGAPGLSNQVFFDTNTTLLRYTGSVSLPVGYSFQINMEPDSTYEMQGVDSVGAPVASPLTTFSGTANSGLDSYLNLSEINVDASSTTTTGIMLKQAFTRILQLLTGQVDCLLSDYLDQSEACAEWNYLITNGLFIRNIDQSNITTSFKFLFENIKKSLNIDWQLETDDLGVTRIRIEKENYFYGTTIQATYTNPKEFNIRPQVDKLINQVKIGFTDAWKSTSVGGNGEVHTEIKYFLSSRPVNQVEDNTLDLRSEIIAGGTAIEYMRRIANNSSLNNSGAITVQSNNQGRSNDQPNDNKIFIITTNKIALVYSGQYNPFTNDFTVITYPINTVAEANCDVMTIRNNIFPTIVSIYNGRIAPAVVAIRWLQNLSQFWFRASLANQRLKWLTDLYQRTYTVEFDEDCIFKDHVLYESNGNRTFDDCNPDYDVPLFQPQVADVSFPQELCDFLDLNTGRIRFNSGSVVFEGFILSAENQPNDPNGGITNFKLLLATPIGGDFSDDFSDDFFT